ncbi:MAG TPA: universal stress protein [Chlorobaculum parvum]|uniref:Universal stress protein n=1 Tax=Chlorobaculum parvum TaxID=274539 RepID=A0A7C5DL09_9CHLB|nr:universal stress protein [Chlorobaculum parvum]
MIQLSRILCPTDYSDASDKALRYAVELARRVDAHVRFLHIREKDGYAPSASDDEASMPESFSQMLMSEIKNGLQADVKDTGGEPKEVIISQAEQWGADLIVMGSHGRSGLMRLMMGSVAEAVYRSASIPVLLIKQDAIDKTAIE